MTSAFGGQRSIQLSYGCSRRTRGAHHRQAGRRRQWPRQIPSLRFSPVLFISLRRRALTPFACLRAKGAARGRALRTYGPAIFLADTSSAAARGAVALSWPAAREGGGGTQVALPVLPLRPGTWCGARHGAHGAECRNETCCPPARPIRRAQRRGLSARPRCRPRGRAYRRRRVPRLGRPGARLRRATVSRHIPLHRDACPPAGSRAVVACGPPAFEERARSVHPGPLPTFSFPSGGGRWFNHFPQAAGAHSVRLATRHSARRAVAPSGPAALS